MNNLILGSFILLFAVEIFTLYKVFFDCWKNQVPFQLNYLVLSVFDKVLADVMIFCAIAHWLPFTLQEKSIIINYLISSSILFFMLYCTKFKIIYRSKQLEKLGIALGILGQFQVIIIFGNQYLDAGAINYNADLTPTIVDMLRVNTLQFVAISSILAVSFLYILSQIIRKQKILRKEFIALLISVLIYCQSYLVLLFNDQNSIVYERNIDYVQAVCYIMSNLQFCYFLYYNVIMNKGRHLND